MVATLTEQTLADNRIRSADKILLLQQIDDKAPLNTLGTIDKRLFKGENALHAVQDESGLWSFKYEQGGLQEPLKRKFTTFGKALTHAKEYYKKRNVQIVEVKE